MSYNSYKILMAIKSFIRMVKKNFSVPCLVYLVKQHRKQTSLCACFPADAFAVSLYPLTSSLVAGGSVSLICSAVLFGTVNDSPEIHWPVFQWAGPENISLQATASTSGKNITSILTLSTVRTSQAGQYTCASIKENSTVNMFANITIQSTYMCAR